MKCRLSLKTSGKFLQLYTEHTAMDENGEDLSGGEMQKLAIIRAVFKDAPFLILDEPTSSLDPNAEYKIYLLDVTEHQKIKIVNKMVYELCENNDIILAAGQANSIPFSSYMLDTFPVKQNAFLMGLQSDLIVLCVNPFDSIDYIHYTIQYLQGISQCMVCSLVLFPMTYYNDCSFSKEGMDWNTLPQEFQSVISQKNTLSIFILSINPQCIR